MSFTKYRSLQIFLAVIFSAKASFSAAAPSSPKHLLDLRGVWQAAFNQDASRALVKSRSGEIALWDIATGNTVPGEIASPATGFVMNPAGSLAAIGYAEGTRVFDVATARAVSPMLAAQLRDELTVPAVFSPDGETLVIFEPEQASIWKVRSGARVSSIPFPAGPHEEAPAAAIFTATGADCFLMDPAGTVTRYETMNWTPTSKPMRHPRLEAAYEFGCAASEDGKWLATFDDAGENGPKGQLQLWDARTSKALGAPLAGTNGFSARFLAGSERVLIMPSRGAARVLALPSLKEVYSLRQHDDVEGPSVDLTPDGKWALAWGADGDLALHNAADGKQEDVFPKKATIMKVLMAPDSSGSFVVYDNSTFANEGHQDYYVVRLKLPDLDVAGSYRSQAFVRGTRLSPDGGRLLLLEGGDDEERLVILNAADLRPIKVP